jgi:hypothetical protein
MAHYSGASAAQLSDSAAGVVPPGFFAIPLANWGAAAAWPDFIPALSLDRLDPARVTMADFYTALAGYYPLSAFSQFNRLADSTQLFFYILTKNALATPDEWAALMQASVPELLRLYRPRLGPLRHQQSRRLHDRGRRSAAGGLDPHARGVGPPPQRSLSGQGAGRR